MTKHSDGDIIEGRDLMVYVNTSTAEAPTFNAQAAATNHTISYSAETKERVTKDTASGAWSTKRVTKLSASIKCECLYVYNSQTGIKILKAAFKNRQSLLLKYGFASEEAGDEYEKGLFIITSLEEASPADGDATVSVTFESNGEITTETVAAS